MQGKTGTILGVLLSIVFIATAVALTGVTLIKPADDSFISGIYTLNATTTGNADNASFWNSTDGITWSLIGSNVTAGNVFTISWNTLGLDITGVAIRVNASNDTTTVSGQNSGIKIDNTEPVITNIANGTPYEYNITITWTTDELANSTVSYYNTTLETKTSSNDVTSHSLTLTNLLENTFYQYNVTSCDKAGNCRTETGNSFKTDSKPPVITSVSASTIHSEYAIISWMTNEPANSTVNYGTTTALGSLLLNSTLKTSHSINITGLENGTLYYYNVTSCDAAKNCNTTGPKNFTTLVDTTPPNVALTYINETTTIAVHVGDLINITASIEENTNVSTAWVNFEYNDGTSQNKTMTLISVSGNISTYSLLHNVSKSGQQNITVYATDLHSNTGKGETRTITGYGEFTITANITSPFKNFSYGENYIYKITVINDNNITENYTLSTNITNISGWSVSQSSNSITNLASLDSHDIYITVTVPLSALNNTIVTTYINSSESNHSASKSINFNLPLISISMPNYRLISNNSNNTNTTYYYYNTTNETWHKEINITGVGTVTSEVDGDITSVSTVICSLTQNGTHKYSGVFNATKKTCWFNATSITPGSYNLTLNATHNTRKHTGIQNMGFLVPSNLTITLNNPSAIKGNVFTMSGKAEYSNEFPAPYLSIYTYFSGYSCNGTTNYAGIFGFNCVAPLTAGNFQIILNSSQGVWGLNGSTTGLLTVTETQEEAQNQTTPSSNYIQLNTSASSIILNENKTIELSILNNRTTTQTYTIQLSHGDYRRFFTDFSNSITIQGKQVKKTNITLIPIENARPGTYPMTITVPEENIQKTVNVIIPEPSFISDEVNINRFIEEKNDNSSSNVIISLANKKNNSVIVEITEEIPKEFANHTDYLIFNPNPTEIIDADPIVMWIVSLEAGETKEISYTANKLTEGIEFKAPSYLVTNVLEEYTEEVETDAIDDSRKLLYIIIIIILTAIIAAVLLYKDEIFKKGPDGKFIKPTDIIKNTTKPTEKKQNYESPYPGRKLDSFGEKTGDILGKPLEQKKKPADPKKVDYSSLK